MAAAEDDDWQVLSLGHSAGLHCTELLLGCVVLPVEAGVDWGDVVGDEDGCDHASGGPSTPPCSHVTHTTDLNIYPSLTPC